MISDILYKRTIETPEKIFIYYKNNKYSYIRFNKIVNYISYFISKEYSKKFINIKIKNKLFFFASIIGCNRSGKIPVLISENNIKTTDIDDEVVKKIKITNRADCTGNSYNENDTQAVVFSSGTTGPPKGAALTFNNFYQNSIMWDEVFKFNSDDVYLNMLPINHVGGLCIMFRALYNNFSVEIENYSLHFLYSFKNQRCTYASFVPSMLYDIINNNLTANFKNIKKMILGGSNINSNLLEKSIKLKLPIFVVYGMTETCSGVAGVSINKSNYNKYKYSPFKNVYISVDNLQICIKSPTVMKKYYKNSNSIMSFTTSDLGDVDEIGDFTIKGRSDSVIISGGEIFSIDLIERTINKVSKVNRCRVVGVEDEKWGQKTIAFIETDNKSINREYIFEAIKDEIDRKMIPKDIYIVSDIDKINTNLYL